MVRGLRMDNKTSFFSPRVLSKLAETTEVVTRRDHKLIIIIKVIINAHNMDQGLIELYSTSYVSPYQSCAIFFKPIPKHNRDEKTLSNLISVRNPTQSKFSFAKNAHELIWFVVSPYRCNKRHNISLFCVEYDCECIEKMATSMIKAFVNLVDMVKERVHLACIHDPRTNWVAICPWSRNTDGFQVDHYDYTVTFHLDIQIKHDLYSAFLCLTNNYHG